MSISAPREFWNKRAVNDFMCNDTIVSIMKMSPAELGKRINLANAVLESHSKAHGLLDGKLDKEMYDAITHYRDMITVVYNNPLQYEIKPNLKFGFGMDGGLRSYIS